MWHKISGTKIVFERNVYTTYKENHFDIFFKCEEDGLIIGLQIGIRLKKLLNSREIL